MKELTFGMATDEQIKQAARFIKLGYGRRAGRGFIIHQMRERGYRAILVDDDGCRPIWGLTRGDSPHLVYSTPWGKSTRGRMIRQRQAEKEAQREQRRLERQQRKRQNGNTNSDPVYS